jgi:hypothetical protein
MSSKETKLFTQDSEHWYIETAFFDRERFARVVKSAVEESKTNG